MLERNLELDDKIEVEEKLEILLLDRLTELTPTNCTFFIEKIQEWDATELQLGVANVMGPINLKNLIFKQSNEIQKQFIRLVQAFCSELENASNTAESAKLIVNCRRRSRDKEMDWLENNKNLLVQLAGHWIAIEGDRLIGASKDFIDVSKKVKEFGITVPFIIYIPEPTTDSTLGI